MTDALMLRTGRTVEDVTAALAAAGAQHPDGGPLRAEGEPDAPLVRFLLPGKAWGVVAVSEDGDPVGDVDVYEDVIPGGGRVVFDLLEPLGVEVLEDTARTLGNNSLTLADSGGRRHCDRVPRVRRRSWRR